MRQRSPVDLLITGSRLITPKGIDRAEVAIDGGKIVRFGRHASMPAADDTISLPSSSLLLPGVVDVHAHLRDLELSHKGDFTSESQAAAVGGVTFVIDMPNSRPPTLTASSFEMKKRKASGRVAVDLGINLGVLQNEEDLVKVKENIAFGEIFLGPSTEGKAVGYDELALALRIIASTGKVACIHAEDSAFFKECPSEEYDHPTARPPEAEYRAVSNVLRLNQRIGARLHFCHLSTRESLLSIRRYKSAGMPVTCEVTPHHLILSRNTYDNLGTAAKMNPPLREPDHLRAMLDGVRSGLVDILASDHAPHTLEEKNLGEPDAPSGVPGFETFVPTVLTCFEKNSLTPSTFVRLSNINPARIFHIPGKGFGTGRDADLVVLDTKRRKVDPDMFLSKAKYSPFSGMNLKFWPIMTIVRGRVIAEGGEITLKNGGDFVPAGDEKDGR